MNRETEDKHNDSKEGNELYIKLATLPYSLPKINISILPSYQLNQKMIIFFIIIEPKTDNNKANENKELKESIKLDENVSQTSNSETEAKDKPKDSKEGSEIYLKLIFFINFLFQNKKTTLHIICKISK